MSVKHKFNIFEEQKNVWYSYGFGWFLWKFSMIMADFLLPGSGWQNETDPNESVSGSATLVWGHSSPLLNTEYAPNCSIYP